MNITVRNLITGEKRYYTCDSRAAVLAAYAQDRGDYNTWLYERDYAHLLTVSLAAYYCGDWGAYFDGR